MCRTLDIHKESFDGELFSDLEPFSTFEKDEPVLCGCFWGAKPTDEVTAEEIKELHDWLMEHLKPFLSDPRIGRIVIEVT